MTRLLQYRVRELCAAVLAGLLVCLAPACADSGRASTPERAARGFLAAVAAGKATDALAFLRLAPPDRRLLTDEVLADAVSRAPVTQIVAAQRGGGDARHATVDVAYQVDGLPVTDTYEMVRAGGEWFLDEPLPTVPEYSDHPAGVDVMVGGVVTEAGGSARRTSVLPGRYQLSLDHSMLTVSAADFTVPSLHGSVVMTGNGPQTHLTPDASKKVATAAADTLTACLAVTTLRTACGFSADMDGAFVQDSHGRRTIELAADSTATWSLEPGGTDLATLLPDWGACGQPYEEKVGVCVNGIRVAARFVVRSRAGVDETFTRARTGYLADISDPDQIRIVFLSS